MAAACRPRTGFLGTSARRIKPSRSNFTCPASLPEKVTISVVSTVVGAVGKVLYDNYVSSKKDVADLKAKQHAVDMSSELAHKNLAHEVTLLRADVKALDIKLDHIAKDVRDLNSKQ